MRSGLENMRAAIFDLDGTLLDSLHIWEDIDEEFLQKRGLAVPEGYCEAIASMGGSSTQRTMQKSGLVSRNRQRRLWRSGTIWRRIDMAMSFR